MKLAWESFTGRRPVFAFLLFAALCAAGLGILAPFFQKQFLDSLTMGEHLSAPNAGAGFVAFLSLASNVLAAFFCVVASQGCVWLMKLVATRESIRIQEVFSKALYAQTLYLHPHERNHLSVGDVVTLYAQDVSAVGSLSEECLPNLMSSLMPLIVAPIAIGLLYQIDFGHVALVAAFGLVVCFLFGWRQAKLFDLHKETSQARVAVVNEWLQNLKLLRVSGRMNAFEQKIRDARLAETQTRVDMVTNASVMNAFAQVLPQTINLLGLLSLLASKKQSISPGDVFGILWVFGVFLNMPLRQLPWAMVNALDGLSSLKRIHNFLLLPSVEDSEVLTESHVQNNTTKNESALSVLPVRDHPHVQRGLFLQGLKVFSRDGRCLLSIDSFECREKELIAVVGEVGSGKSVFLSALHGDLEPLVESYVIDNLSLHRMNRASWKRYFSVVPQNGFVMNANLRKNLMLEYGQVGASDSELLAYLSLADFDPALERLDAGLNTSLGERGVNLSGGQRQRLGLARATHFDRPIVLLDDSLSAVDVATEQTLMNELVLGHWKDKRRIIVTHRLSLLKFASRVLFLCEGKARGFDTFERLYAQDSAFREFLLLHNEELQNSVLQNEASLHLTNETQVG